MENSVRKREWVKTAAIIFLAVLLVLTFFSKTIMNASLPEVAAQQAASGAINARIRGSGTVEASEVYNVTIKQTRKVASVLVKTGQEINVGDTMFVLEAEDSDELKQAELDLETLQQNYDKSLIEAGNTSAKDNREVQKARDAYNEALAIYNQYSTMDPSQIAVQKVAAEQKQKELEKAKAEAEKELAAIKDSDDYKKMQENLTTLEAAEKSAKDAVDTAKKEAGIPAGYNVGTTEDVNAQITRWERDHAGAIAEHDEVFQEFYSYCNGDHELMSEYCKNDTVINLIDSKFSSKPQQEREQKAKAYKNAFAALEEYYFGKEGNETSGLLFLQRCLSVTTANDAYNEASNAYSNAKRNAEAINRQVEVLEARVEELTLQVSDQSDLVSRLTDASSAAETVKSAKKTLEDLLFEQGLGDSSSVDMEAARKAIERKQAEVDKLRENADELEVKSSVSGTIASINASAGKSIGGEEQPLATINVTDRGFTVKIDVTNDQAKKVKTGDTAELVNFWGGDAVATLDQITSSQTAGNRTLVFTLTGDIQAGQNVTLSIGQKSANYDALIPLSGLREDSNGKFVYVLESKSSPLGSRYIATRVTVQELARDDKSAAVSGISSGDFIITTSNKPVEAGKQVRLADNG